MIVESPERGRALYDVCVFGAGPAGITVARALDTGLRVALVEAGGAEPSADSQGFYEGQTLGDPLYDLSTARLRCFGGTSGHWSGWCRPLDDVDFSAKDDPIEAWPMGRAQLDPFLSEACSILDVANTFPRAGFGKSFDEITFQISPTRFRDKYFEAIRASSNIDLMLDTALFCLFKHGAERISSATVKTKSGRTAQIRARVYVLATGGIENSRLLLFSNQVHHGRLFGPLPIGQYWMEHPTFALGDALIWGRFPDEVPVQRDTLDGQVVVAPRAEFLRAERIGNIGLRLNTLSYSSSSKRELLGSLLSHAPKLGRLLLDREISIAHKALVGAWEQPPEKENAITLTNRQDAFGMPRVRLAWRKGERVYRTARVAALALAGEMASSDSGRLRIASWLLDSSPSPEDDWIGGRHHMGGTRMAVSPAEGVVDGDARVFGTSNLYIAGSSVFPSSGHANPTLTLVQLSLRLAKLLNSELGRLAHGV